MASFFRYEAIMNDNVFKSIINYRNNLYKNDAKAFSYIPVWAGQVQNLIKNGILEKINWNELIERISVNYNAQSVIGIADTISELVLGKNIEYINEKNINSEFCISNKECIPKIKRNIYKNFFDISEDSINEDNNIVIDIDSNIAVNTANGLVYLNSVFRNNIAESSWIEQIKDVKYYNLVVIYGMANNSYIRQLVKSIDKEIPIMVYEPDVNIFKYNYIYTDMEDLLTKDNLYYIVEGLNTSYIKDVIKAHINYTNIGNIESYCSPGYDVLYATQIKNMEQLCRNALTDIRLNDNSIIKWSNLSTNNSILNMEYMVEGTDIYRLKKQFGNDVFDIPAIIVAAGPSLDKNIEELKYAKGKAFILGVDSSIRMMLKHNILPDAFVTLDPNKERVLFEDDMINDIPFFYNECSTHDVLENNRAKLILYNNSRYIYDSLNSLGKNNDAIDVGGSVACSAFSIARYLGFKNIIVIGQDLAFTDNKKHASTVYEETPVSDAEGSQYTTIEGANGEELLTYINFKSYRDWYEYFISHDTELNMINSTEGGALIHGAKHMSLKKAIDEYCKRDFNFSQYIQNTEVLFEKSEAEKLINLLKENIANCKNLKNIFEKCIECYQLLCKSSNEDEKEKCMYDIDKLIDEADKYSEINLIESYTRQTETVELYDLYDEKNVLWNDIAKKGINVSNSYLEAIDKVQNVFYKGIENIEKKCIGI